MNELAKQEDVSKLKAQVAHLRSVVFGDNQYQYPGLQGEVRFLKDKLAMLEKYLGVEVKPEERIAPTYRKAVKRKGKK